MMYKGQKSAFKMKAAALIMTRIRQDKNQTQTAKKNVNLGKETEYVEHKKSTSELREGVVSVCAMLNKHGEGTLYFGVKNDGTVVGQEIGAKTMRDVGRAIMEHISPVIYPTIGEEQHGGMNIIKVTFEGSEQPYQAYHVPYVRVSDEDKQMTQAKYDNLLRARDNKHKAWESQRSEYTIKDLDLRIFNDYLKRAKDAGRISFPDTDPKSVLTMLDLMDGKYLLNAGAALFVKSGINDLQIARFASDEKLTFTDMKRHHGSILELVEEAMKYLINAIDWRVEFNGGRSRIEIPEIPTDALREAVTNAFAHRVIESRESIEICVYKSTITISSYGTFPKGLTPQSFIKRRKRPVRRNPLIAQTLYYSKDMESHATGLKRIQDACDVAGCKVEYERGPYDFTVIFHRHCGEGWGDIGQLSSEDTTAKLPQNYRQTTAKLPPNSPIKKVFEMISRMPNIPVRDIAKELGMTEDGIRYHIKKLSSAGIIRRVGNSRSGHWEIL